MFVSGSQEPEFTSLTAGPLGDDGNGTGVAWADHDGDGDLDLYLVHDGSANALLRNDLASGAHWLHLDLVGVVSNRSAIGARVRVMAGGVPRVREVSGGSGYLSQDSMTLEFGLGTATMADSIVVRWPSGIVQVLRQVSADQRVTITEPGSVRVEPPPATRVALALDDPAPNPAAGPTRVRYSLPTSGEVELAVHDLLGRRVATLVRGIEPAGWHAAAWDGRDRSGSRLRPGIYVLRLSALGQVRTRTCVRIR